MLNILLAEDNRGDILLVQRALDEHHIEHELHVVRDGEEALAAVSTMGQPGHMRCPDLMLLDLNLPKVDGPEVLTQFRKHPACARTPVVVITSSDAGRDRSRMAALGIARYFRKPTDLDEFMELGAVVRELVGEAAEPEEAAFTASKHSAP
jgi:chemotaxis family two-component system response regulator Rcp1